MLLWLLKAEFVYSLFMVPIFKSLLELIVMKALLFSFKPPLKNLKTQMYEDSYYDLLRV